MFITPPTAVDGVYICVQLLIAPAFISQETILPVEPIWVYNLESIDARPKGLEIKLLVIIAPHVKTPDSAIEHDNKFELFAVLFVPNK